MLPRLATHPSVANALAVRVGTVWRCPFAALEIVSLLMKVGLFVLRLELAVSIRAHCSVSDYCCHS